MNKIPPALSRSSATAGDPEAAKSGWKSTRMRKNTEKRETAKKTNMDKLREKYKDLLMSDLEINVKESTNKLEKLLVDLDEDHDYFMDEIYQTERYLETEDEKIADRLEAGNKTAVK